MRFLLFETVGGKPIIDLEVTSADWDTGILAQDKVSARVPGYTHRAAALDLRGLLTPYRVGVAVQEDDGRVPAAGILTAPVEAATDDDGRSGYALTMFGVAKLFESRHVRKFPGWPLIGSDGKPTGEFDLDISGVEYGTIQKRLVQESMLFAGGALPIEFEPDRVGTRQRLYEAVEGKPVLDACDDIADLLGGVEYDFVPRISDQDMVSWEFVTGTDAKREISSAATAAWRLGGHKPDIRGYSRSTSGDELVDEAIFAGGKDDDSAMFARATSGDLIAAGFPRRELWDTSHTTVSVQSTLDGWAANAVANGSGPVEFLTFEVRADSAVGLRHGDYIEIQALDHWDMPDGIYSRRVLSVGGAYGSDWKKIVCMGEVRHG